MAVARMELPPGLGSDDDRLAEIDLHGIGKQRVTMSTVPPTG
jgi:hypothetical protein